jgi:hypothetical protein
MQLVTARKIMISFPRLACERRLPYAGAFARFGRPITIFFSGEHVLAILKASLETPFGE